MLTVGRSELAAGVAAVPLCGFVTTSSDPATEPGDGVLLVCRSSRLRRCRHPVASLDPRLQAHTKHDRPGIAYRQALTDFLADPS